MLTKTEDVGPLSANPATVSSDADRTRSFIRDADYVSKTDISTYRRCPYSFHLVESGVIRREDLFSPTEESLLDGGVAFENSILEQMPTTTRRIDDPELRAEAEYIYGIETIIDRQRKLIGRPDGFDLTAHAPIEIKHRTRPSAMDRLELAFYWLLLEPMRTTKDVEPYGWLDLSGSRQLLHVRLLPSHFAKVRSLIDAVRRARRDGVLPMPCDCHVCSGRVEVQDVIRAATDIGMVMGIKTARADMLRGLGVPTVAALVVADPVELAEKSKSAGTRLSVLQITEFQHHARALNSGQPEWIGADRILATNFIGLDLEYISGLYGAYYGGSKRMPEIFVFGVVLEREGERTMLQRLITKKEELGGALRAFGKLLRDNPDLPIFTWNGTNADLRYLERAAERHRVNVMDQVEARHLDLLAFARRVVRLPIASFELKTVGPYLGMSEAREVRDGFAAVALYQQLLRSNPTERASLRNQLLAYNRDDLEGLIRAATFLRTRDLSSARACITTYQTIELQTLLARKRPPSISMATGEEG